MNICRFFQGLVLIVVLGVSAGALRAQDFDLFVMGGGSSLFDKRYYSVYGAAFGSTYKTGDSFTVGAEFPVPKIKLLSVEGAYGFVRNNLAVTNFYNSSSPSNETDYPIRDQRVSADVIVHPPKSIKDVRPYLALGVEYDRFSPTGTATARAQSPGFNGVANAALSPEGKFGFNVGGGMDIRLTSMLAFRIDFRDHATRSPTYGLPYQASSTFTAYYPISGPAHDLDYSIGLVFHFGK